MGQFIEVNHIYDDADPYEKTKLILLNKALITDVQEDNDHNQTYITYNGKQLRVRDNYDVIRAKLLE